MAKTIKISDIKIPDRFLSGAPKEEKIQARMADIKSGASFPVVRVNRDGWLSDGYASYQAALRLGLDEIPVKKGRDTVLLVRGTHFAGGQVYTWEVPHSVAKKLAKMDVEIRPGLRMAAMTAKGVAAIRVTETETVPWPTEHKEIIGLWVKDHKKRRVGGQPGEAVHGQ